MSMTKKALVVLDAEVEEDSQGGGGEKKTTAGR